eukprot:CAMPEP_0172472092 /NCGR_PEP_ID=MMETSP1065-20121228/68156_1 /TAXON_ID=265537 /ORGANISM="Amphiprora paludosa, Strain CCMP125" /LENGTH=32 /DNA_ID= /DNA_START= /DNA_END= /DNA_ORIENTATION=
MIAMVGRVGLGKGMGCWVLGFLEKNGGGRGTL